MIPFPMKTFEQLSGLEIGVFDYETNGLLDTVTTAHCAVLVDPRGIRDKMGFSPADIEYSLKCLNKMDVLVGHNIIGYDLPMLKKVYDWEPRGKVIILDTLWMSRMFYPDISGAHSLKAWGIRIENEKGDYIPPDNDWNNYNDEMYEYCLQDGDVNRDIFNYLLESLKNFSWRSIMVEMNTARIIQRQMSHGFVFKHKEAEMFHATLTHRILELEDIVHSTFFPLAKAIRVVQPKVKVMGELSSVGIKSLGKDWADLIPIPEYDVITDGLKTGNVYKTGSFTLIEWPEFNLGSRQQIGERLTRAGYKLTKKTKKTPKGGGGTAIIDDAVLDHAASVGIAEAVPLAEYFMITKREGMLKDWLKRAVWHEDEGVWRIHGYVNSIGANTNRMTHNSPNVAQTPGVKVDRDDNVIWGNAGGYGAECRDLWTVAKGYKLVGCDADGLELRCLAHYMGDDAYSDSIINGRKEDGTDIHSVNQRAAGIDTRHNAKTFIYAFLYGAGDGKIGSIIGAGAKAGKRLKEDFLDATPALRQLRSRILNIVSNRKWLKGVDGRILRIRSAHSALNTLLQGMGAIIMKYWLVEVARIADAEGLDWNPVANVHDEGQFEVLEAHVARFEEICEAAFLTVSDLLQLKCVCTGTAQHGDSWLGTH